MKRILVVIILTLTTWLSYADQTLTVNSTSGNLSINISESDKITTTELTVIGTIDLTDLEFINDMSSLEVLDLSQVSITDPLNTLPSNTFSFSMNLIKIVLPTTLEIIENSAFNSCENLQEIEIPASVSSIETGAFEQCSPLFIVDEDNLNYSSIDGVLYNKSQSILIKCPASFNGEFIIPDGTQEINDGAFENCDSLQKITLPESITTIGQSAFSYCSSLKTINLPNSVTKLEAFTFSFCSSLDTIYIPASIIEIDNTTFFSCPAILVIDETNTLYTSTDGVLFNFDKTTLISFPDDERESYIIPESVTTIGERAFYSNNYLKTITFPSSLKYIKTNAFSGCSSLTEINIPDSVTEIESGAFSTCSALNSVILPQSITTLNGYVFAYCYGLETFEFPISIDSMGTEVFSNCFGLKNVNLSETLKFIGHSAFTSCNKLETINIPQSVKTIGANAFESCESLDTIQISSNVETIGESAFEASSAFLIIDPDNLNYSSENGLLFNKNKSTLYFCPITTTDDYTIPETVTKIDYCAFKKCASLQKISIPESVIEIGAWAIRECEKLDTLIVNNSTPVNLDNSYGVFFGVDQDLCILQIPFGSLEAYKSADQWKDFQNIIEEDTVNYQTSAPTGESEQYFCDGATLASIQLSGNDIKWYSSENDNSPLDTTLVLISGNYYYASQTVYEHESEERLKILAVINNPEISESLNPICEGENVQIVVNSDLNSTFNWSTGESTSQIDVLATETLSYWVDITVSSTTCRKSGIIEVINTPSPIGDTIQSFNEGDSVACIKVSGDSILWYSEILEDSPISLSTLLVENAVYYASQSQNGCESQERLQVTTDIKVNVDEFELLDLEFYPNPVNDYLTITTNSLIHSIKVFNSLNLLVQELNTEATEIVMDLSTLSSGSYYIQVDGESKRSNIKILKK
jgi:hypothetical protein